MILGKLVSESRRKARGLALKALYEIDSVGHPHDLVTDRLLQAERLSSENTKFIHSLVNGVILNRKKIDVYFRKLAPVWPINQIPIVDRNIIRLAIFEILLDNKVPLKVAINEAVELAKIYGSDNSARFVNGVLGSVSTLASR